jgi:trafficking protein particle complex subunit 13
VRIAAEIISPSNPSGRALDLEKRQIPSVDGGEPEEAEESFGPGDSLQRILRLSLHEEGDHTLAVTVTYTETTVGAEGRAAGGRVRTFRKLYQFAAANLISVRTKACDVQEGVYALEAQLENLGEYGLVLEVSLICLYTLFYRIIKQLLCILERAFKPQATIHS